MGVIRQVPCRACCTPPWSNKGALWRQRDRIVQHDVSTYWTRFWFFGSYLYIYNTLHWYLAEKNVSIHYPPKHKVTLETYLQSAHAQQIVQWPRSECYCIGMLFFPMLLVSLPERVPTRIVTVTLFIRSSTTLAATRSFVSAIFVNGAFRS